MNSDANLQIPSPDFRRNIQAAFKRHRPLGTMQSSSIGPRRTLVPQSKSLGSNGVERNKYESLKVKDSVVREVQEDASITPPSFSGTMTKTFDDSFNQNDADKKLPKGESHQLNAEKNQFSTTRNAGPQEMEWDTGDQKHRNLHNVGTDDFSRSEVGVSSSSLLAKRTTGVPDQFKNFLSQPVTQSSVVRSSCATTTYIHSTSAPMPNSTTYCSRSHTAENSSKKLHHLNQESLIKSSNTGEKVVDHKSKAENDLLKEKQGCVQKEGDIMKQNHSSDATLDPCSKARQQEKAVSSKAVPRKRNYDPDFFFKVNGKLYQRLGKIGSGGSSEVHKVISSDCKIFALKKIKLKGRDYATAFGFCQEMAYLSRLKGKSNIIQLIDYEVTDKALLREVMSGSISNKDGKVKDDGYIYMVLEYGEIDLAHMLSHEWKELDNSKQTIDESWLRFYWQQILLAVNTIHEERIVHSDLKPANFLLVKGSLKLIDFGIAKAIMSDTTNIQRDSQVGTLSYMSPEAFMCNERDADGNTIKCGRPSDIWSLGCILYQMVYGRTPFAEYKTFWAKFKVITDPNHKIKYEPLSNPWLLDIMKKCLAWDRNERWRIPELLQHPFLVPPIPQPSLPEGQNCKLLQFIAEASGNDPEASVLCSELERLLRDPVLPLSNTPLTTREQQCKLLGQVSKLCCQLQERLTMSE